MASGLTVIEVIRKFFVDRKINQPNEYDSDKKPGGKGKNPIFTKIIIIKIHHSGYFDTKLILHYSYGKSLTSAKNRQYYNSLSMIEEPVSML